MPDKKLLLYGTTPTGLEEILEAEIRELFADTEITKKDRGKIWFKIALEDLEKIHFLRTCGNLTCIIQGVFQTLLDFIHA